MITTLFLIQLIAVQIWYATSNQVKHGPSTFLYAILLGNKQVVRWTGIVLLVTTTALFVARFGWMTGICVSFVGIMGVASLVVLLNPLRYVRSITVIILYVLFVALEFLI